MSQLKIDTHSPLLTIEPTKTRETPKPAATFQTILRGGANLLLSGAQAASTLIGSPMLSAAVSRIKTAIPDREGTHGVETSSTDPTAALGKEQLSEDLQLLALQREIQRHDRQITLLSNVLKARHDTAKTAIGNIRS